MTRSDSSTERQLAVAREVLKRHETAMSILSHGDHSPHMTDEMRAKIESATEKLAPHTVTFRASHPK